MLAPAGRTALDSMARMLPAQRRVEGRLGAGLQVLMLPRPQPALTRNGMLNIINLIK